MGNLKEELERFNAINKYTEKLVIEQAPPKPAEPPIPPVDAAAGLPPEGATELPTANAAAPEAGAPPEAAAEPETEVEKDTTTDDTTEEIDMTDLVNMTKSIKKQLDDVQAQKDTGETQKMDDVFTKLNDLEAKLGEMDNVLAKIDQLGAQIEQSKPKTPMEKLEMRSLDSYPFSKKPDEFFSEKLPEMRDSGKNEYVLTKGDVENYGRNEIMKSFNPKAEENDYNF